MMIHRHEESIDNDAQGDEQLHERIEDNEGEDLLHPHPAPAALPHTQDIDSPETRA